MLYFAYGSNMDEQRVRGTDRCPEARFIFNAVLPGYRLVFIRRSEGGDVTADVVADPDGSVWGVVYDITDSERRNLDAREGIHGQAYRPKEVLAHPHGDIEQRVMVLTYTLSDPGCEEELPTPEYLGYMLRGARRWGLPDDYIAQLDRIRVRE